MFPGCPELRDGSLWPNDGPGFGIDIDEIAAARYRIRSIPSTELGQPFAVATVA